MLRKAHEDAYTSLLEDLQDNIHEYEALKRGEFPLEELRKVAEISKMLIKARIAQGISLKELADRLDLEEQEIQQYEANDYASATLGVLGTWPWSQWSIRGQTFPHRYGLTTGPLQDYVASLVHGGGPAGGHYRSGIVFFDDQRAVD